MLSGKAKYKLFKTHCMPLYGSIHWDLSSIHTQGFFTQWRKCVRKIFNIPYQTHSNLLSGICEDLPVENQILRRAIKFYGNAFYSTNSLVKLCTKLVINGSLSKASNTLGYIFIYLGFYVALNTVQVISRRVVGRAEETSTYSSLGFCTVNCRPTASNYQLSHLRPCRESNPGLRGGRRECYHSATVAPHLGI